MFITSTKFGNVAVGRIMEPNEQRDSDQSHKSNTKIQRFNRARKKGNSLCRRSKATSFTQI